MFRIKRSILFLFLLLLIFFCTSCHKEKKKEVYENKKSIISNIKVDDNKPENVIRLYFQGNPVNLSLPVYNNKNRIFIPLEDMILKINGQTSINNSQINITFNDKNICVDENSSVFWHQDSPSTTYKMKKAIIYKENKAYISLFDLSNMLDLKVRWDIDNKKIYLYCNREKREVHIANQSSSKYALIRLEDITAAQRYENESELEKLRIVGDYLYSQGIPFHIAWVPRYIDKTKNIDNDPSSICSMYNADFVYTMDYLINDNGLIGLHGYTHQYGDEISIDGCEFSRKYNTDEKSIRGRLQMAIDAAKELDFDYAFFETPHYAATDYQHRIMEDYFDYIYDPCFRKKGYNGKTIYVSTDPLNYVDGKGDLNNMLRKIGNLKSDALGSFFYHPSIEFEFIKVNDKLEEYPDYQYDENSVLHHIINEFNNRGYKFITIKDIK